ncbi:MAG: hypothetical protein ABH828_04895 [archaeon]
MSGTIENLVPTDMIFKPGNHTKLLWKSNIKYNLFIDSIILEKYNDIYVKILKAHITDYGTMFPIEGVLKSYGMMRNGKTKTKLNFIIPLLNQQGITTDYDKGMLKAIIYPDKRMLETVTPEFQTLDAAEGVKIEEIGFIPITKF